MTSANKVNMSTLAANLAETNANVAALANVVAKLAGASTPEPEPETIEQRLARLEAENAALRNGVNVASKAQPSKADKTPALSKAELAAIPTGCKAEHKFDARIDDNASKGKIEQVFKQVTNTRNANDAGTGSKAHLEYAERVYAAMVAKTK